MRTHTSRIRGVFAIGAIAGLAIALFASGTAGAVSAKAAGKKYTIYVSNNYIGNPWRAQMENQIKALVAKDYPNVNLQIVNSQNTVTSQTSSLQSIIRSKPAGILIDSASATALNPTVASACAQGITVYTFDQVLTAPCAYEVRENDKLEAENMAKWLAAAIHYKGDVFVDQGIPGAPASAVRTQAYESVLRKYPGIHIAGTFVGNGAPGPELQQVSSLLASHHNVVGVVSEGYCSSEYQAFNRAGLKPPACASLDTAASAETCMREKMKCYMWPAPSWVGAVALKQMMTQLTTGKKPAKLNTSYEPDYFVTPSGAIKFSGNAYTQQVLKAGVNYFPKASSSLVLPAQGAGLGLTVQDALKG